MDNESQLNQYAARQQQRRQRRERSNSFGSEGSLLSTATYAMPAPLTVQQAGAGRARPRGKRSYYSQLIGMSSSNYATSTTHYTTPANYSYSNPAPTTGNPPTYTPVGNDNTVTALSSTQMSHSMPQQQRQQQQDGTSVSHNANVLFTTPETTAQTTPSRIAGPANPDPSEHIVATEQTRRGENTKEESQAKEAVQIGDAQSLQQSDTTNGTSDIALPAHMDELEQTAKKVNEYWQQHFRKMKAHYKRVITRMRARQQIGHSAAAKKEEDAAIDEVLHLQEQLSRLEAMYKVQDKEKKALAKELEDAKSCSSTTATQLSQLQESDHSRTQEIQSLRNQLANNAEILKEEQSRGAALEEQIARQEQIVEQQASKIQELAEKEQALRSENAKARQDAEKSVSEAASQHEAALVRLKSQLSQAQEANAQLTEQLGKANEDTMSAQKQEKAFLILQTECDALKAAKEDLEATVASLTQENSAAQRNISSLQAQKAALEKQAREASAKADQLQQTVESLNQHTAATASLEQQWKDYCEAVQKEAQAQWLAIHAEKEAAKAALEEATQAADAQTQAHEAEVARLSAQLKEAQDAAASMRSEAEASSQQQATLQQQLQGDLENIRTQLTSANEEIEALKNAERMNKKRKATQMASYQQAIQSLEEELRLAKSASRTQSSVAAESQHTNNDGPPSDIDLPSQSPTTLVDQQASADTQQSAKVKELEDALLEARETIDRLRKERDDAAEDLADAKADLHDKQHELTTRWAQNTQSHAEMDSLRDKIAGLEGELQAMQAKHRNAVKVMGEQHDAIEQELSSQVSDLQDKLAAANSDSWEAQQQSQQKASSNELSEDGERMHHSLPKQATNNKRESELSLWDAHDDEHDTSQQIALLTTRNEELESALAQAHDAQDAQAQGVADLEAQLASARADAEARHKELQDALSRKEAAEKELAALQLEHAATASSASTEAEEQLQQRLAQQQTDLQNQLRAHYEKEAHAMIQSYHDQFTTAQQTLEQELAAVKERAETAEDEQASLRAKLKEAQLTASAKEMLLLKAQSATTKTSEEASGFKEKIAGLEKQLADASKTMKERVESLSLLLKGEAAAKASLEAKLDNAVKAHEAEVAVLNNAIRLKESTASQIQAEADSIRAQLAKADEECAEAKSEVESMRAKIAELQGSLEAASSDRASLAEALSSEKSTGQKAREELEETSESMTDRLRDLESKLTSLEGGRALEEHQHASELHTLKSQHQLLQEENAKYIESVAMLEKQLANQQSHAESLIEQHTRERGLWEQQMQSLRASEEDLRRKLMEMPLQSQQEQMAKKQQDMTAASLLQRQMQDLQLRIQEQELLLAEKTRVINDYELQVHQQDQLRIQLDESSTSTAAMVQVLEDQLSAANDARNALQAQNSELADKVASLQRAARSNQATSTASLPSTPSKEQSRHLGQPTHSAEMEVLKKQVSALKQQVRNLESDLVMKEEAALSLEKDYADLKAMAEEKEARISALVEAAGETSHDDRYLDLESELRREKQRTEHLRSEITSLKATLQQMRALSASLSNVHQSSTPDTSAGEQIILLEEEVTRLQQQANELRGKLNASEFTVEQLQQHISGTKSQLADTSSLTSKVHELQLERDRLAHQLKTETGALKTQFQEQLDRMHDVHEREVIRLHEENEQLRIEIQLFEDEATKHYESQMLTVSAGDPDSAMISSVLNDLGLVERGLSMVRISKGTYLIKAPEHLHKADVQVQIQVRSESVLVRSGGGYRRLQEYMKRHYKQLFAKKPQSRPRSRATNASPGNQNTSHAKNVDASS